MSARLGVAIAFMRLMAQHGRDHDQRRFHNNEKTTRRRGERADDEEDRIPPPEPAPAAKMDTEEASEA